MGLNDPKNLRTHFQKYSAQPLAEKLWVFFRTLSQFFQAPFSVGVVFVYFRWKICHVQLL